MTAARYDVQGSTATLTFDNPAKRNAITADLLADVTAGVRAAERDPRVRAIVLTHTGNTFCAGADLSGQVTGSDDSAVERITRSGEQAAAVYRLLAESPRPVIAAIHGHVRAGGMGFVASSDFVVAGPQATFGLSEVRIGVVAAIISPPVLSRIGQRTAAEWLLRGGAVTAAEAAAAGLVTRAVDHEEQSVEDAVGEILADLRKGAPAALAASKRLVNREMISRMDREHDAMIELSATAFANEEGQAGIQSFLQRTAPPWELHE